MNDVKGHLVVHAAAVLRGVPRRGLGARDNLPVREGNHVRRPRNVHEPFVDPGDDTVRDDGDLDFAEPAQGKLAVAGMIPAFFQRQGSKAAEPGHVKSHGTLSILDVNAQAAETGGTEGRGEGTGVWCRSVRASG